MRFFSRASLLSALCLALSACPEMMDTDAGVDASVKIDAGVQDSGVRDSGVQNFDAGADAGRVDAGVDGGIDGGSVDAGVDAGLDAGVVVDAGTDAGLVNDAGFDAGPRDAGTFDAGSFDGGRFCSLPGSYVRRDGGTFVVPGGMGPSLSWLTVPDGFCAHYFGTVGNARTIRFAPGGDLFVASPTTGTTGGGAGGRSAIVVAPDDNHDGYADTLINFRDQLPSTQGILFANGKLYYQDNTRIRVEPFDAGQRVHGTSQEVVNITYYASGGHWPKTMDISDDGTIYVSNGGDQGEACELARPVRGGVLALDPTADAGFRVIAKGLRNPMFVRCHRDGHNGCFAAELSRDYSASINGREKLIPLNEGDDWGYPCCAAANLPYDDSCLSCSTVTGADGGGVATSMNSTQTCRNASLCSPMCVGVKAELTSYVIADTPFGFDFVDGQFPAPWRNQVFVALHGEFGTWRYARVIGVETDVTTGQPKQSSTLAGTDGGPLATFASGWDDNTLSHGRPADVTVSPDGRLFIANDVNGDIIWIAPVQ